MLVRPARTRSLLVAALAALLLAALTPVVAAADGERVVLSVGHTDAVAPHYADGRLWLRVKDDTHVHDPETVFRDPAEVIFHAKPEAMLEIPPGLPPEFSFLGDEGASVWILPETQDPNLLWPGFSSESIGTGLLEGDALEWHLERIEGPAAVNLWNYDPVGTPLPVFRGAEPLPQTRPMGVGVHAHYNWGFGAEGLYTLTFEATASAADGTPLRSGPTLYRFFVGDLAELPEIPLAEVSVNGLGEQYTAGEAVALSASQAPDTGLEDYRWARRCGDQLALEPLAESAQLDFTATLDDDGCEYFVTLYSGTDPVAISAPATLAVAEAGDEPAPPAPAPAPATTPAASERPASAPEARRALPRKPRLWLSGARLQGRLLLLGLRLNAPGRIDVAVTRGGKTLARVKGRSAARGKHPLRVRLDRRLDPGRYSVRISAHTRGPSTVKAVPLRTTGANSASHPGRAQHHR